LVFSSNAISSPWWCAVWDVRARALMPSGWL
jgi:hypothetical protein